MDKAIHRLNKLIKQTRSYNEFEVKAINNYGWYLTGLQHWTKKDLKSFYEVQYVKSSKL